MAYFERVATRVAQIFCPKAFGSRCYRGQLPINVKYAPADIRTSTPFILFGSGLPGIQEAKQFEPGGAGRRQLAWPVDDNYLGRQDLNREGSEARVTVIS